ncbi:Immunodominant staphylococcal antigen A precursor [Staphylococcus aureus]|uniref:Immunodominant staphylococcal antigen A n=1 Tax=Staphylococcus aureus TaxID=1280 RepID=A0A2X2MDX5_STAAU|nr:Immunodominant staphylococcal antigen A precursor [Staphylococcus aureus]
MAQRTGVPASTWAAIIARESMSSKCLQPIRCFRFIPNYARLGPTNTVDQQINAAVKAYKAQGLGAWGF